MDIKKNNKVKFDGKIIAQMCVALLPVQILSVAVSSFGGIINGLVIGNFLSPEDLLALGFVTPMTAIIGALAAVIAGGSRIMSGRYMGRSEVKKLDYIFTISILLAVIAGAILTTIGLTLSNPIATLLGANGSSQAATATYVRGIAIGIIPMLMNPALMVYLQMGNKSTYSFISTVILAASNLIFSLLNVTVINGGIFGMGLAASISQIITMIFLLLKFCFDKHLMHWDIRGTKKGMAINMIKLGSPTAVASLLYAIRNLYLNVLALECGGEIAVSALALVNSVAGVFDAVNIGYGATVLIIASLYFGEKDKGSLKTLARVSLRYGLSLAFAKLIIIIFLGKPMFGLFGAEGLLLEETYQAYIIQGLTMPVNILTLVVINEYQAFGRAKFANVFYLVNAIIAPLGYALLTKRLLGVWAIWSCIFVAEVIGLIFMVYAAWRKNGKKLTSLYDILCINEEFGEIPSMNLSICNMAEVTNVAEKIQAFCKERGIDKRRSMMAGLCFEEMARNVVAHGFSKKRHRIDIYVGIDGEDIKLRLRNNSTIYNPIHTFRPFDPGDPFRNIGIRMVNAIAKDMNYQSSFGMNILSIDL